MTTRRALLGSIAGVALSSFGARTSADEGDPVPGLARLAAQRGVFFGSATSTYQIADPEFERTLIREVNILTAEYEMKRKALQPSRNKFDFSASDALLSFSNVHAMRLRGHTLCWHAANPPWLVDALASERDERLLTKYIARVVGRYKGHVHSWDVVNEALFPEHGRSDKLRNSPWLQAFGPGYIDMAFHAAREADPHALLVYNDWGCEAGPNDRFREATLTFLSRALARGVPIDALGLQGHLSAFGPPVDQTKLRNFLAQVKAMGLKLLVTEHDVDDQGGPADTAIRDREVGDVSRRFLDVIVNARPLAIITWGLSDRFLDPLPLRERLLGRMPRKLPFDWMMRRKPMWWQIEASLAA